MSVRHLFATLLVFVAVFAVPIMLPASAHAQTQPWTGVCVGGPENPITHEKDVATIQGFECLLANVLTVFIALIGLTAFVMIVVAAFRYLLSGGNTKGTEQARSTVTYAILGIVVALSAFIILNLLSAFTGVNLTNFFIPRSDTVYPTVCTPGALECKGSILYRCNDDGQSQTPISTTGCQTK